MAQGEGALEPVGGDVPGVQTPPALLTSTSIRGRRCRTPRPMPPVAPDQHRRVTRQMVMTTLPRARPSWTWRMAAGVWLSG